jgi:hypothetical protein
LVDHTNLIWTRNGKNKEIFVNLMNVKAENYEQKDKHNRLENSDTENFNFKMEEQKLALKELNVVFN